MQALSLLLCEHDWHSSICLNLLKSRIMFCGILIMFCSCWIKFLFAFEWIIGSLQLYCSFWEGSSWKGFSSQNFNSYAFWCKGANKSHRCPLRWLFFEKYYWNILANFFSNKSFEISLYYFVKVRVKKIPKKCHFQSFPNPFTSPFTLFLKVQVLME